MDTALYFTKPCPACRKAEKEDLPGIIGMKYIMERKDVRNTHLPAVEMWRRGTNGAVPAVWFVEYGKSRWYAGLRELRELASRCKKWLESTGRRRMRLENRETPSSVTVDVDVDPSSKSLKDNEDILGVRSEEDIDILPSDVKV